MKKLFITGIILIFFSLIASPISAAPLINANTAKNFTSKVGKSAEFTPITLGFVIAAVIKVTLSLLTLIFIILIILAGFRWMTAGGNEENIKKAQDSLRNALIGLIIILIAWGITYFVFTYLPFSGGTDMAAG